MPIQTTQLPRNLMTTKQSDTPADQLWDPYRYLEGIPGKGLRVTHIQAFNTLLQAPEKVVENITWLVERLHNVSLLLDDIEDHAVLRRGRPVAHTIYGIPRTINTASYVMIRTLHEACGVFPECQEVLFEELMALHEGQGMELYWRDMHICPSEEEYKTMVFNKTGGLYRLAVKLLQGYSPHKGLNLVNIADMFGILYQIQDDLLNLSSERYKKNKGFAEDISEGKYSFPVIHCLDNRSSTPAVELAGILKEHTNDVELKERALNILIETGSIAYTQKTIARYYYQALKEIDDLNLPDSEPLKKLLDKLIVVPILPLEEQA